MLVSVIFVHLKKRILGLFNLHSIGLKIEPLQALFYFSQMAIEYNVLAIQSTESSQNGTLKCDRLKSTFQVHIYLAFSDHYKSVYLL